MLSVETFRDLYIALQASSAAPLGISRSDFPERSALTHAKHEQLGRLLQYTCAVVYIPPDFL